MSIINSVFLIDRIKKIINACHLLDKVFFLFSSTKRNDYINCFGDTELGKLKFTVSFNPLARAGSPGFRLSGGGDGEFSVSIV